MPSMDDRWPFFTVDLELTNVCYQGCIFCPRERLTRPQGFMPRELFAKIATQLAENGSRVTFCGMGNPLLHPELETFGQLCMELNLNFGLTIQAPALNQAGLEKIAALKPGFIEVSLPTISPGLYAELFPGQALETALNNLDNLVVQRGGTRGITVNAVVTALETENSEKMHEFWLNRGINFRLHACHSRGGNLVDNNLITASAREIKQCGLFATHSFITWNGQLLACCHDLTGETFIADLTRSTIREAAQAKLRFLEAPMPFKICKSCDEPAADRPIPLRPFPESGKARSRYLKSLCQTKNTIK